MIYDVLIKEEAYCDIQTAYDWYEICQNGLGERFIIELEHFIEILRVSPHIYRIRENQKRFCPLKKFPYLIVYEIQEREILVYAVFNTYQHPSRMETSMPG